MAMLSMIWRLASAPYAGSPPYTCAKNRYIAVGMASMNPMKAPSVKLRRRVAPK